MKRHDSKHDRAPVRHQQRDADAQRFPDWRNVAKPRWRDALRALAAPASRVHRYRNLRSALFYDLLDDECFGNPHGK